VEVVKDSADMVKDGADTPFLNRNENSIPSMQLLFWFVHYNLTNYRLPMNNLTPRVTCVLYKSGWRLEKKKSIYIEGFRVFTQSFLTNSE
jgi:hypothetical protein